MFAFNEWLNICESIYQDHEIVIVFFLQKLVRTKLKWQSEWKNQLFREII